MAANFRLGGSAQQAGEPFFYTRTGAVPTVVTQQRDFLVRCDRDYRLWRREQDLPPGSSVDTLINQRTSFSSYYARCPDSWGLDVLYARNGREAGYAEALARVVAMPAWLDDKRYFDHRLILADSPLIANSGIPSDEQVEHYMPYDWRRWERSARNRHGVFVAAQHREVLAMRANVVPTKYPRLPPDWERYEVPYGFSPQCPPVVTYCGLALAWNPASTAHESPLWKILYTEHAWTAAAELVHEARQGRLWGISPELMNGIEDIGLEEVCHHNPDHVEELDSLLAEIRVIRWSRVPRSHGLVPPWNKFATPVYGSGDFVAFDAANWTTWLSPDMYLPHDRYGRALVGPDGRGLVHYGRLREGVPMAVPDADIYGYVEPSPLDEGSQGDPCLSDGYVGGGVSADDGLSYPAASRADSDTLNLTGVDGDVSRAPDLVHLESGGGGGAGTSQDDVEVAAPSTGADPEDIVAPACCATAAGGQSAHVAVVPSGRQLRLPGDIGGAVRRLVRPEVARAIPAGVVAVASPVRLEFPTVQAGMAENPTAVSVDGGVLSGGRVAGPSDVTGVAEGTAEVSEHSTVSADLEAFGEAGVAPASDVVPKPADARVVTSSVRARTVRGVVRQVPRPPHPVGGDAGTVSRQADGSSCDDVHFGEQRSMLTCGAVGRDCGGANVTVGPGAASGGGNIASQAVAAVIECALTEVGVSLASVPDSADGARDPAESSGLPCDYVEAASATVFDPRSVRARGARSTWSGRSQGLDDLDVGVAGSRPRTTVKEELEVIDVDALFP